MEVTNETITALRTKMEEAKTIYLKWAGALEVMESMMEEQPKETKIIKKDKKVKK